MDRMINRAMYDLYMEDALLESTDEMTSYLTEAKAKEDVYKINYIFRDKLQVPKVTPVLKIQKNRDAIVEMISKFLDDHHDQLCTSGPVYTFVYGEKELAPLYAMFEVSSELLLSLFNEVAQDTYHGELSKLIFGFINNAPQKILFTAILVDAIQNNYEEIIECCEYMWAFTEYPILYRKFWKLGVKEDVMDYTINHLSTKYMIRKLKTLQHLLKYDAHVAVTANTSKLREGYDHAYIDLTTRMRNQIKNKMKNISRAYYVNYKNNQTSHSQATLYDDGSLADNEGYASNMAQAIDNTIDKFLTNGINASMIKIVAEGSQVDKSNLAGYMNQIWSTKNNRIPKMIEDIVQAYYAKYPSNSGLGTKEFVDFGLSLYRSINSSNDTIYKEIREILNYWMFEIIDIKKDYQREGTWTSYTRAIFNYIVFMIVHYN